MVRAKLNDGTSVLFKLEWDEMHDAFQEALSDDRALTFVTEDGTRCAVNPNLISYFELVADQNGGKSGEAVAHR